MAIDAARALNAELPEISSAWTADDVVLYHLGIGAGSPPLGGELEYTFEKSLKVLPSFAVLPAAKALPVISSIPGLEFDYRLMLHGEQEVAVSRPLPAEAKVVTKPRLAALWDKGKAAVAVFETETVDEAGAVLFVTRFSLFLRGVGGFGGDPGPKREDQRPSRVPDVIVESPTLPQQALLYRLCGDKNPLHADPAVAARAGFDRPILHGLCSYGIVCKAVVDNVLDGDTTRIGGYRARFAGSVYPGEVIVTSMWDEGDRLYVEAATRERATPVLSNTVVSLVDSSR